MPLRASSRTWFSRHFGLSEPQYELPFVDFLLDADVPLYIDSYAITKDPSALAGECHNAIVSYFEELLRAVRSVDAHRVRYLLRERLVEPKEIHLGVGKRARSGRGVGPRQEQQLIDALIKSEALKTGAIQSIQELELHIPGIGPDKISDLVANIIKGHLAGYTEQVCTEFGIATRPCAVSAFWNAERLEWDAGWFELPAIGSEAFILVPKRFIRRDRDLLNHREFYDHYVLDVLQREMLTANDALVETLKNGKQRVTKKALREDGRFPHTKEFISAFIQEHPETIEEYRSELEERFRPADPAEWSGKAQEDDPRIDELLAQLHALSPGRDNATTYHRIVQELIEFVFDWCLENFDSEYSMDQGRGKVDIIADNFASGGLFAELRQDLHATSVPMECKNYTADLGNDQFNQINDRLGPKTSRIGFSFCRTIRNREAISRHVGDRWLRQENCILVFDDDLLKRLVTLRLVRDVRGIESQLRRMIRDVKYAS